MLRPQVSSWNLAQPQSPCKSSSATAAPPPSERPRENVAAVFRPAKGLCTGAACCARTRCSAHHPGSSAFGRVLYRNITLVLKKADKYLVSYNLPCYASPVFAAHRSSCAAPMCRKLRQTSSLRRPLRSIAPRRRLRSTKICCVADYANTQTQPLTFYFIRFIGPPSSDLPFPGQRSNHRPRGCDRGPRCTAYHASGPHYPSH